MGRKSLHDALTGLPNRDWFMDRLADSLLRAKQAHTLTAVCVLDLDRFKLINEGYGREAADALLAAVGKRLQQALRPADAVARVGEDEFVLLLEELGSEDEAVMVARRAQEALRAPFHVDGDDQHVNASIGIACGGEGFQAEELIRNAGSAMDRAKELGRDRLEVYEPELRERALSRLMIERGLRVAIEEDRLKTVYQPIVSLAEGRIAGFETLVRWEHPVEGTLLPETFIAVAEDTGLIVPIGRIVLERACAQAALWHHSEGGPRRVYVNVSPRQLMDPDFLSVISAAVRKHRLEPGSLCIEITETALMDDTGAVTDVLEAVRDLGVLVVLDDFGTGYSSLTHLSRVPIDEIKIDRFFVERLDTRRDAAAIVTAVTSLARELGVDVVAEGVETDEELTKLRAIGCDLAQGYRFARPMGADAAGEMLAREADGELLVATA